MAAAKAPKALKASTASKANDAVDRDAVPAESQIDGFLARYSPGIAGELRDARHRLRAMFPRGVELVFDNYNALVFGISPTERSADAFVSVAGYPKWVTLFFLHGASLDDPHGLLEGSGKQVRSIRLRAAADIDAPAVAALVAQAARPHGIAFAAAPPMRTVVKMALATQRPRRPPEQAAARRTTKDSP